jgi:hypothetical protein
MACLRSQEDSDNSPEEKENWHACPARALFDIPRFVAPRDTDRAPHSMRGVGHTKNQAEFNSVWKSMARTE